MAGAGSLEMISGGSGFPIWAANGNQPGMHLGSCVLSVDDVNGDGMVDIMLGCRYADLNGLQNNGLLRALSGANGLMLWEYVGESSDMRMGEYLRATKDLNGDGSFDVISWSESADTGGFSNNGCIRAHDGASGSEIWRYDGASSDERMGDAIAIGDDFDLDGVSDIYVATSYMDSQGLADNGRVVALSAGTTLSLDDNGLQAGTSSTLTATGFTSNAEVYFLVSLEGPGTSLFSRRDIPVALKEPIHMIGSAFSDASGIAEFLVTPPSKLRHTQIWMQAIGQGGGSGSRINRTPVHPAVIY
jgi:hypothetical protein